IRLWLMGELQICNSTMKLRKLPVVWVVRVTPRFWGLLVIPKFGVSVATITTFVTVDAFTPLVEAGRPAVGFSTIGGNVQIWIIITVIKGM
ncbi:hypothetical protein, partial [Escherichia coli]|uniref:hypothetical protein n=1 Tax=Escherichia coli TaxID=562 RepID=UPI001A7E190B